MKPTLTHLTALLLAPLAVLHAAETRFTFPYPVPANHLRIVAWNLKFFNDRSAKTSGAEPDRTPAQLDALAQRIEGFDAAVVVLQEIDQIAALNDLRKRMGGSWAVFAGNVLGFFPQQNALLYDASKVDLLSAAFVHTNPNTNFTPSLYPTWTYRCPVSGVFCPKGRSNEAFRVIGIHCHHNDPAERNTRGLLDLQLRFPAPRQFQRDPPSDCPGGFQRSGAGCSPQRIGVRREPQRRRETQRRSDHHLPGFETRLYLRHRRGPDAADRPHGFRCPARALWRDGAAIRNRPQRPSGGPGGLRHRGANRAHLWQCGSQNSRARW